VEELSLKNQQNESENKSLVIDLFETLSDVKAKLSGD
jgi:hypothetical protein